jgi:hypothetical protein
MPPSPPDAARSCLAARRSPGPSLLAEAACWVSSYSAGWITLLPDPLIRHHLRDRRVPAPLLSLPLPPPEGWRALTHGNNCVEVVWTIVPAPSSASSSRCSRGAVGPHQADDAEDAMPIEITGRSSREHRYRGDGSLTADDIVTLNQLHFLVGVRCATSVQDVIHPLPSRRSSGSGYDAVPGTSTHLVRCHTGRALGDPPAPSLRARVLPPKGRDGRSPKSSRSGWEQAEQPAPAARGPGRFGRPEKRLMARSRWATTRCRALHTAPAEHSGSSRPDFLL